MIQLTASGPRVVRDGEWMTQQREFADRHCVVFEDFVEESILNRVPRMLETSRYEAHEHVDEDGVAFAREFRMRHDQLLVRTFELLLNQHRLFEAIAELTGSEREIRCFAGRCYKRLPDDNHFDGWHDDGNPAKLYGLSINLSPRPVQGGAFHIRSRKTGEVFRTVSGRFGDAHLFRIHRSLEHKVSPVQGIEPRCAYAGWFRGGVDHPDYRDVVRKTLVRV